MVRLGIVLLTTTAAITALAAPASAASVGTVKVFDNFVKYQAATGKANRLVVTNSGTTVTIDDRYRIKAGKGCTAVNGDRTKVRCKVTSLDTARVLVNLSDGNDYLINKSALPMTADGARGRDTLIGGSASEALLGGAGKDELNGGAGNDHLNGTTGHDSLRGGTGDDSLAGGTGDDVLRGGAGNDSLAPGLGADAAYGNSGDDIIQDRTGNDTVDGGTGNDTVDGGAGNDKVYGNTGNDRVYGGYGFDKVYGGAGDDLLNGSVDGVGGTLYDTVGDQLDGGNQTDTCEIVPANDSAYACEVIKSVG